jgi:xanthine dehydrogenase large subunit
MLALSVREALRQACAAFGPAGTSVDLASPATPEVVFWALDGARSGTGVDGDVEPCEGPTPPVADDSSPQRLPESEAALQQLSEA